jgi:hypothetical protein
MDFYRKNSCIKINVNFYISVAVKCPWNKIDALQFSVNARDQRGAPLNRLLWNTYVENKGKAVPLQAQGAQRVPGS